MTTVKAPIDAISEQPPVLVTKRRRWVIAVLVVAVAALAFGSGVLLGQMGSSDVPSDVDQLLERYLQAWEEKDEALIREATTEDFVINEYIYRRGYPNAEEVELSEHLSDDIDGVVSQGFSYDWRNEKVGEAIVTGDGPWFVSVEEDWFYEEVVYDGLASYVVVDDNGTLRIANHYWAGLRYFGSLDLG